MYLLVNTSIKIQVILTMIQYKSRQGNEYSWILKNRTGTTVEALAPVGMAAHQSVWKAGTEERKWND